MAARCRRAPLSARPVSGSPWVANWLARYVEAGKGRPERVRAREHGNSPRARLAGEDMLWEMSRLHRVRLDAGADLTDLPGPRWVHVHSGAVFLDAPGVRERIGTGDAVLLDARTPHRIAAAVESVLAVADLRTSRIGALPSPLIVRCFATRHPGLNGLVGSCPQQAPEVGSPEFTESYGNLIAAAMAASWREDRGEREDADPVVESVVAALSAGPGQPWTVERMAGLVHLSRSALGERFRRALGRGPTDVLRDIRMDRARALLRDGELSAASIAARVGYGSAAAFSRAFTVHHGVPPQQWRRGQRREGARTAPKPIPAAIAATAPATRTTVTP